MKSKHWTLKSKAADGLYTEYYTFAEGSDYGPGTMTVQKWDSEADLHFEREMAVEDARELYRELVECLGYTRTK